MSAKKIAIMVDNMYQVLEVWYPYYRLREAGMEVNFVAAEAKKRILFERRLSLRVRICSRAGKCRRL